MALKRRNFDRMNSLLRKLFENVIRHRKAVIIIYIVAVIVCAVMSTGVSVNYDIKDYLPADSPSTVALEVMKQEYEEGTPNARVMVKDVSIPEALRYKAELEAIDGVDSVKWLDDSVDPSVPLAMSDEGLIDTYYKDGNALYQVTVNANKRLEAVSAINELIGEENAAAGDAVATAAATASSVDELKIVALFAVLITLAILVIATTSWAEPALILMGLGVAILINMGTNLIFGEISFVTNASGSLLQLAVSLDYSVFLIHRFSECRKTEQNIETAMVEALCRTKNSILSSGMTTIIGFLALVLMRFEIGPDLGLALAKGVIISLITVLTFVPACFVSMYKLIEKTQHRNFMPDFTGFGRLVRKVMIPMVCIFVLVLVPAYMASNSNDYNYGASRIFGPDTDLGRDTEEIKEVYGKSDTYALMVPVGNLEAEQELSDELKTLPEVTNILSYVDTVGAEIPTIYLDKETLKLLNSDEYTRMVISLDIEEEGAETFLLVEEIRSIAQKYYPDTYHLAGGGVSSYDLMNTITSDMVRVNLIAIAAVYLVLLIMLRSLILPLLLVLSIETAIWINLAFPYFMDTPVFYIAYLIISSVQLGATVDYAILMSDRYREHRHDLDKKEAVVTTVSSVTGSILVSGLSFVAVGFLLGYFSSHGIMSQLGMFIGRGGLCSMAIVFLVLPGLLYLFDGLYIKEKKNSIREGGIQK